MEALELPYERVEFSEFGECWFAPVAVLREDALDLLAQLVLVFWWLAELEEGLTSGHGCRVG